MSASMSANQGSIDLGEVLSMLDIDRERHTLYDGPSIGLLTCPTDTLSTEKRLAMRRSLRVDLTIDTGIFRRGFAGSDDEIILVEDSCGVLMMNTIGNTVDEIMTHMQPTLTGMIYKWIYRGMTGIARFGDRGEWSMFIIALNMIPGTTKTPIICAWDHLNNIYDVHVPGDIYNSIRCFTWYGMHAGLCFNQLPYYVKHVNATIRSMK